LKHFIEAYSTIDETAKITGVALIPRISRNDNLYTKEELRRFHNVRVPLNWEHDGNREIGSVTFKYNPDLETVYYDGEVTDEQVAALVKNKTLFTSIEANPTEVREICNGPNDCFSMPFGLIPVGLALTETPGVPETSVTVLESYIKQIKECERDRELERKYANSIKKGIDEQSREPETDAIINDFMKQMTTFLEAQIKSKYDTLQLYKAILTKNPEDATARIQAESHINELKGLIKQLLEVRKDNEFTSPETMPILKDFESIESICSCCGDFITKEDVNVSGDHSTPKLDKKKEKPLSLSITR